MFLIYQTTNLVTGSIYVGCHITDNIDDGYKGSGTVLKRAIKKYGEENFVVKILEECNSVEEMLDREKQIVNEQFVNRADTYNLTLGGGSFWHINSTGRNLYGSNRENFLKVYDRGPRRHKELFEIDPEYQQRFKDALSVGVKKAYLNGFKGGFIGKKHTEKTKEKIGMRNSVKQSGERNSQFGTCWIKNRCLGQTRKIRRSDLLQWLERGWETGRIKGV